MWRRWSAWVRFWCRWRSGSGRSDEGSVAGGDPLSTRIGAADKSVARDRNAVQAGIEVDGFDFVAERSQVVGEFFGRCAGLQIVAAEAVGEVGQEIACCMSISKSISATIVLAT